jgi:hypothetical protein
MVNLNGEQLPMASACRRLGINPKSARSFAEKRDIPFQEAIDHYALHGKHPSRR